MDAVTGPEAVLLLLWLQVHINDSFGLRLLTLIGDLGWFKAGGTLRDQAKISTSRFKSFSSRWGLAPARATSSKSFLKKIKI